MNTKEGQGWWLGQMKSPAKEEPEVVITAAFSAQAEKLLFWKKYVFGGLIPFICDDSLPFFSFFTFNQPDNEYSCKSKTRGD